MIIHKILLFAALGLSLCFIQQEEVPDIFMIGDSTMADKPVDDNPERGWGQLFPEFFNNQIKIKNFAKNGRSTKSFIKEGLWQKVIDSIKAGDYLFIQFGHNDSKIEDTNRYAEPNTTYRNNLIRYIKESRSKGALPILLTPVTRRWFDSTGNLKDMHQPYSKVVKEVAAEMNVPLIDHYSLSRKVVIELGAEKSKSLYLWVDSLSYKRLPHGKQDDTHFNEAGAYKMASLVIDEITRLNIPLKQYLAGNIKKKQHHSPLDYKKIQSPVDLQKSDTKSK